MLPQAQTLRLLTGLLGSRVLATQPVMPGQARFRGLWVSRPLQERYCPRAGVPGSGRACGSPCRGEGGGSNTRDAVLRPLLVLATCCRAVFRGPLAPLDWGSSRITWGQPPLRAPRALSRGGRWHRPGGREAGRAGQPLFWKPGPPPPTQRADPAARPQPSVTLSSPENSRSGPFSGFPHVIRSVAL